MLSKYDTNLPEGCNNKRWRKVECNSINPAYYIPTVTIDDSVSCSEDNTMVYIGQPCIFKAIYFI